MISTQTVMGSAKEESRVGARAIALPPLQCLAQTWSEMLLLQLELGQLLGRLPTLSQTRKSYIVTTAGIS